MPVNEKLKEVSIKDHQMSQEGYYWVPNFNKAKEELIETLDKLIEATKKILSEDERCLTFDKLRNRIHDDFNFSISETIKVSILDRVKPLLEDMLRDKEDAIGKLTNLKTQGQTASMGMCWPGIETALKDLPIENHNAENTIAAAKREAIIQFSREYLAKVTIRGRGDGNQTHDVIGLYNCVCEEYGLDKETDAFLDISDDQTRTRLSTGITTYINEKKLTPKYASLPDAQTKRNWIENDFKDHIAKIETFEERIIDIIAYQNPIEYVSGERTTRYHISLGDDLDALYMEYLYLTDREEVEKQQIIDPLTKEPINICDNATKDMLSIICKHMWREYMKKHGYYNPDENKNIVVISVSDNRKLYIYPTEIYLDHIRDSGMSYNIRTMTKVDSLDKIQLILDKSSKNMEILYKELQKRPISRLGKFPKEDIERMKDFGYIEHIIAFIAKHTDINSALVTAVEDNSEEITEYIIKNYREYIDFTHKTCRGLLHLTINNKNIKLAKILIKHGANANMYMEHENIGKVTPMIYALGKDEREFALQLAEHTSEGNKVLAFRFAVLHKTDCVEYMIKHELSKVDQVFEKGMVALHFAAVRNDPDFIEMLIRNNAKTNPLCRVQNHSLSPLALAMARGKQKAIEYFLTKSIYEPSYIQEQLLTAISYAATCGRAKDINDIFDIMQEHNIKITCDKLDTTMLSCMNETLEKLADKSGAELESYGNVVKSLIRSCPYDSEVFKKLIKLGIKFNAKNFIGDNDINEPIQELIKNKELDSLAFWDGSLRYTLEQEKQLESHSIYIAYHFKNSCSMENIQSHIQSYQDLDLNSVRKFFCDCSRASTQNENASKILDIKFTDNLIAYHVRLFLLEMALHKLVQARPNQVVREKAMLYKKSIEDDDLINQINELDSDFRIVEEERLYLKIWNGPDFRYSMEQAQELTRPEIYIAEALLVAAHEDPGEMLRIYHDLQLEEGTVDIQILLLLINNNDRYQRIAANMLNEAGKIMSDFLLNKFTLEAQEFLGRNQEHREQYLARITDDMKKLADDQNYKEASELQELIKYLKKNMNSNQQAAQYPEGAASQAAAARATGGASESSVAGGSSATTAASGSNAAIAANTASVFKKRKPQDKGPGISNKRTKYQ